jgi:hypothetical protein
MLTYAGGGNSKQATAAAEQKGVSQRTWRERATQTDSFQQVSSGGVQSPDEYKITKTIYVYVFVHT